MEEGKPKRIRGKKRTHLRLGIAMQKNRTPQKTDRRREKRSISPPKEAKWCLSKAASTEKAAWTVKAARSPFNRSGGSPPKAGSPAKAERSFKETKPLQERRASREKAKIPHAKHQKFPASETPSSDAKQSAISRRLIYFENLARIPKNLLTNRKTHAIINKHDGSAMPEWRNWQTPGT